MTYNHRQTGYLYLIVFVVVAPAMGWIAFLVKPLFRFQPMWMLMFIAVPVVTTAFIFGFFRFLVVRDEGDHLAVRYGPLPLFYRRLLYSEMTAVKAGRSTILDGWGIHYGIGMGWKYSVWGFDYVNVQMGNTSVRIGTDDVEGLVGFLNAKLQSPVSK
jgi:hypothetical protein